MQLSDLFPDQRTAAQSFAISKRAQQLLKAAPAGSEEWRKNLITGPILRAAGCRYQDMMSSTVSPEDSEKPYGTIVATYPDYAIVMRGWDGEFGFKRVPYEVNDDTVTCGEPEDVEQIYASGSDLDTDDDGDLGEDVEQALDATTGE